MAPNMMAIISMVKSTEKENSLGLMVAPTMETSKIITFKVTVRTTGLMEECLLALGSIIKWKEVVHSLGLMAESMKAIT